MHGYQSVVVRLGYLSHELSLNGSPGHSQQTCNHIATRPGPGISQTLLFQSCSLVARSPFERITGAGKSYQIPARKRWLMPDA